MTISAAPAAENSLRGEKLIDRQPHTHSNGAEIWRAAKGCRDLAVCGGQKKERRSDRKKSKPFGGALELHARLAELSRSLRAKVGAQSRQSWKFAWATLGRRFRAIKAGRSLLGVYRMSLAASLSPP